MNDCTPIEPPLGAHVPDVGPILALRRSLGLTLAEMGERCGISKSQMHEVERTGRASLPVALAIEALSQGAIDAGDLNDDVRAARHAVTSSPAEAQNHVG